MTDDTARESTLALLLGEPLPPRTVVVPPASRGQGVLLLAAHAARREALIAGRRLAATSSQHRSRVWRQPLPSLRPTLRDGLVRRLGGGAIVTAGAAASPRWLTLLERAGVTAASAPVQGMDGSLRVRAHRSGEPVMLRVGRVGTAGDPRTGAQALRALQTAGVPLAPRLLAEGEHEGWAWTAEWRLPGARPRRLTGDLLAATAAWSAAMPVVGGEADVVWAADVLASAVPEHAEALRQLARSVNAHPPLQQAVLAHGDLWSGNLLTSRGRLTGVVDWDAFDSRAVPGTDLVHLVATEERLRRRAPLGRLVAEAPWDLPPLAPLLAAAWPGWGDDPACRTALGAAWWLQQAARDLRRVPGRGADPRWLRDNVVSPLRHLDLD